MVLERGKEQHKTTLNFNIQNYYGICDLFSNLLPLLLDLRYLLYLRIEILNVILFQIHAHVTTRLPLQEFHQARSVREMLPQHRKSPHSAQSFPAQLSRQRLH